jgi:hypothetical protein
MKVIIVKILHLQCFYVLFFDISFKKTQKLTIFFILKHIYERNFPQKEMSHGEDRRILFMKLYRCTKKVFCSPIKRYIPPGAIVYKYENTSKISIQGAPQSDRTISVELENFEFNGAEEVSWFYNSRLFNQFFEFVRDIPEDEAGGGAVGLNGEGYPMQIDTFVLDAIDLFNGCVELTKTILIPSGASLSVNGAPGQFIGIDFNVDTGSNSICWTGYELESKLSVGDKITVIYTA